MGAGMVGVHIPVERLYACVTFIAVLTALWTPCLCDTKEYIGCYNVSRSLMGLRLSSSSVTWDTCIASCNEKSNNYNFVSIQDGTHCYCALDANFVSAGRTDDCKTKMCAAYQPCGSITSYAVLWVCKLGYYGPGCTRRCNCGGKRCDRHTGTCTDLCRPTMAGPNCQTDACPVIGTYGVGCSKECHCAGVRTCSKDSGNCYGSCQPGWGGFACNKQACDTVGKWGESCDKYCPCKDGRPCARETGWCEGGCSPGWLGARCDIRTCNNENGGCDHRCSTAPDNSKITCSCGSGWELQEDGKMCAAAVADDQGPHTILFIALIAVLTVLVIVLLVIICCMRRRKANRAI